jgi:hypothetical protein
MSPLHLRYIHNTASREPSCWLFDLIVEPQCGYLSPVFSISNQPDVTYLGFDIMRHASRLVILAG